MLSRCVKICHRQLLRKWRSYSWLCWSAEPRGHRGCQPDREQEIDMRWRNSKPINTSSNSIIFTCSTRTAMMLGECYYEHVLLGLLRLRMHLLAVGRHWCEQYQNPFVCRVNSTLGWSAFTIFTYFSMDHRGSILHAEVGRWLTGPQQPHNGRMSIHSWSRGAKFDLASRSADVVDCKGRWCVKIQHRQICNRGTCSKFQITILPHLAKCLTRKEHPECPSCIQLWHFLRQQHRTALGAVAGAIAKLVPAVGYQQPETYQMDPNGTNGKTEPSSQKWSEMHMFQYVSMSRSSLPHGACARASLRGGTQVEKELFNRVLFHPLLWHAKAMCSLVPRGPQIVLAVAPHVVHKRLLRVPQNDVTEHLPPSSISSTIHPSVIHHSSIIYNTWPCQTVLWGQSCRVVDEVARCLGENVKGCGAWNWKWSKLFCTIQEAFLGG